MTPPASPLRIGFLGCGRVTQHYRTILQSGVVRDYAITACCDLDRAKAEDLAATFGAAVYTDLTAMLAEAPLDLVAILTPSGLHYEHAKAAIEAGFHVLVEKPVALNPAHGAALMALAAERGVMCAVVFQNRYNPAIQALREVMDEGRLGKLVTAAIRLRWCRYQPYYEDGWHGTWAMDGGVINQQAIHHVDALNWLCGPVERCVALEARRLNHLEAEDTMAATLALHGGALATIEVTTAARPRDFEASLSVVGEKGMVALGGIALNLVTLWDFIDTRPGDDTAPQRYSQEVPTGYGVGHGPLLNDVIQRLLRGEIAAPVSADEGNKAVRLIHALYASIEQDGWVELADGPVSGRLGRRVS